MPRAACQASFFVLAAKFSSCIALVTDLPSLSQDRDPTQSVFQKLNSQIGDLEQRLTATKQANRASAARQQKEFRQQLQRQHEEIEALTSANSLIASQVEHLKQSTFALRGHAARLQVNVTLIEDNLKGLLTNLSAAEDFVTSSLKSLSIANSSELQVLSEMAEKDADEAMRVAKKARLAEISPWKVSMMQTKNSRGNLTANSSVSPPLNHDGDSDFKDLVQTLLVGLDSLSAAHQQRMASREAAFRKEFNDGDEKRRTLVALQAELNSTKASLVELEIRLRVAVQHLSETLGHLKQRADAIGLFMRRTGDQSLEWDRLAAIKKLSELISVPLRRSSPLGSKVTAAGKPTVVAKPTAVAKPTTLAKPTDVANMSA